MEDREYTVYTGAFSGPKYFTSNIKQDWNVVQVGINYDKLLTQIPDEKYIIKGKKVFKYNNVEKDGKLYSFYTLDTPFNNHGDLHSIISNDVSIKDQVKQVIEWIDNPNKENTIDLNSIGIREQIEKEKSIAYNKKLSVKEMEEILKELSE